MEFAFITVENRSRFHELAMRQCKRQAQRINPSDDRLNAEKQELRSDLYNRLDHTCLRFHPPWKLFHHSVKRGMMCNPAIGVDLLCLDEFDNPDKIARQSIATGQDCEFTAVQHRGSAGNSIRPE